MKGKTSSKTTKSKTTNRKTVPKAIPAPTKNTEIRIRQIENGFVISKDIRDRKGNYLGQKEEYTKTLPKGLEK